MSGIEIPVDITRKTLEEREAAWCAPYAMCSRDTRGRVHDEPEDDHRTVYRRDRDRIIHASAFRRLEYKTQVFVNHEGDYYRTRLTHTLEVAQIAMAMARVLRLNEDLAEVMALAHDLGHPPFGHAGEDVLRELMEGHGGFDHNLQGLRIVDLLEARYPMFSGLNLSWEVREGINKHRSPFDHADYTFAQLDPTLSPLLELQVVDLADEIAYDNHDLDDGLKSGLLHESVLETEIPMWQEASTHICETYPQLDPEIRRYQIIRRLINAQVTDLVETTAARLATAGIRSVDDVRQAEGKLVGFSDMMAARRRPLRRLLLKQLYRHYRVVRMSEKAHHILRRLFQAYLAKPTILPPSTYAKLQEEAPHRVICDYVGGMTDRYAIGEYQKLFDPYTKV